MTESQVSYNRLDAEASSRQTAFSGTPEAQHPATAQMLVTNGRGKQKMILYGLGVAECVLAGLMIILAVTTLCLTPTARPYGYFCYYCVTMTYSAPGLWGGLFVAVTGILGVRTKKNPSVYMYNANMAMSIVTASLLSAVVTMSVIALFFGFAIPLHIAIAILSFVAMVICIIHSAFCCFGVCCENMQYDEVLVYMPQQRQQVDRLAHGQYAFPVKNAATQQRCEYVMATSAGTSTVVNLQPSQAGTFAQQTVLPAQRTVVQPAMPNCPSTQDNSYALDTENEVDGNPPSYSALL